MHNKVLAICNEVKRNLQLQAQQKTNQFYSSTSLQDTVSTLTNTTTATTPSTAFSNPNYSATSFASLPHTNAASNLSLQAVHPEGSNTTHPTFANTITGPHNSTSTHYTSTNSKSISGISQSGPTGTSQPTQTLQSALLASKRPSSSVNAAGSNKSGQNK